MAYKTYTRQMMANFTGRPVASFPETFLLQSALPQSVLLFKFGTCIVDPALLAPDAQTLVDFAILSMADAIFLDSQYATVKAAPFNSETIGSYSYSKAAKAIQMGMDTGVMWFDLAIAQLSVCDDAGDTFLQGGIEVFEDAGKYRPGDLAENVHFLSPADLDKSYGWVTDPSAGH